MNAPFTIISIRRNCWFLFLILIVSCSERPKDEKPIVKPNDAMTSLNERIAQNPGNAELLYERADYFFQKNNTTQALTDINQAITIDSTQDKYHLLYANLNFKGLQIQNAIDAFKKAIELNPSNGEAHLKLAELYLYIKAYPICLSEANEALKIDKNNAKGYFIKGFAYKEMGDTLKALSSFQTAVEVKSDYYDAHIQLGNILAVNRDPLALQYYNNALRIRPNSTEALYNRGLFLQNVNELEGATTDYNNIIELDPAYSEAHYNLGFIDLAFNEDYQSAIKHFTSAINVNNEYVEAYYNRGLCYEYIGDKQNAVKDYNAALNVVPTYKLAKERLRELKIKN